MLDLFVIATSLLASISGLTVIYLYDWANHRLKFAGIAFSTVCAMFFVVVHLLNAIPEDCRASAICAQYIFFGGVRNCAFIFFHIAAAKDAVRYGDRERRCQSQNPRRTAT
jgi:hypothetical protein